jgi:hypothetical protein
VAPSVKVAVRSQVTGDAAAGTAEKGSSRSKTIIIKKVERIFIAWLDLMTVLLERFSNSEHIMCKKGAHNFLVGYVFKLILKIWKIWYEIWLVKFIDNNIYNTISLYPARKSIMFYINTVSYELYLLLT